MTRLVDTVQQMGLDGEISLLGRWVRLQAAQCLVYVIEVAGGCGYYTWCDAPGERTIEPYLDPAEAIQAGLRRAARVAAPAEAAIALEDRPWCADRWPHGGGAAARDEPLVLLDTGQVCCACGAVEGADKGGAYVRQGDAWFCEDCWQRLPTDAVERVVREVALRGVPLS
jgi:hypothetical protein